MRKLIFSKKFILIFSSIIVALIAFLMAFYLYALPQILVSKPVIKSIQKLTHDILKMELIIEAPKIKTSLSPVIECGVENFLLTKNKIYGF